MIPYKCLSGDDNNSEADELEVNWNGLYLLPQLGKPKLKRVEHAHLVVCSYLSARGW